MKVDAQKLVGRPDIGIRYWLRERLQSASSAFRDLKQRLSVSNPTAILLTEKNPISQSQIFPFHFFRTALARELGFTFHEVHIDDFERSAGDSRLRAPIIFVQPWWDISLERLERLVTRISKQRHRPKIVFLDACAPLDLRFADFVNGRVDVYVKKHVFRIRSLYGKTTRGDTNLVDYYGRLYGLTYKDRTYRIPTDFLQKLIVGPSFATSRELLPLFQRRPMSRHRNIDLHARLGGFGDHWYGRMRAHARQTAGEIRGIRLAVGAAAKRSQYLNELRHSKICFSPFGYGEVCWRDFEAVACGAMLIKPDMAHVETDPDIFRAFESYVPVKWDFSDLDEKVRHFLANDEERQAIASRAYSTLHSYFANGGFVDHIQKLLMKLGNLPHLAAVEERTYGGLDGSR